jgi:hypothetical protein
MINLRERMTVNKLKYLNKFTTIQFTYQNYKPFLLNSDLPILFFPTDFVQYWNSM